MGKCLKRPFTYLDNFMVSETAGERANSYFRIPAQRYGTFVLNTKLNVF